MVTGKAPQHVLEHTRNVVVIVIAGQAAAERDRSGREHRTSCGRLEIDDLGADQVLWPLTVDRREMREQIFRHGTEMALMAFRARQDQCTGRRPQREICAVELEPGGTAA